MKRLAFVLVLFVSACGSSGKAAFDHDAARKAWLETVAPFVPVDVDAAIDTVDIACTASNSKDRRTAEVTYHLTVNAGDPAPFDAAMTAGCANPPDWWVTSHP